jgi:hypothetical protein
MKRLYRWFVELDRILRGEATRIVDLRDASIEIPARGISFVLILLGMFYGVCMGCYALVNHDNWMQMLASTVKVPALFFLSLVVTLPSLYVFNALVGSRLTLGSLVRLFIATLGVNLAVLSSLGPIVAFFSVNTTTYGFMVLLNVVVFVIAGILGLTFLLQTLQRLHIARYGPSTGFATTAVSHAAEAVPGAPLSGEASQVELTGPSTEPGPLDAISGRTLGRRIKVVFTIWMIVFGLVGAQMSWILRPFVGSPDVPFQWFRPRGSNFFESVFNAARSVFGF